MLSTTKDIDLSTDKASYTSGETVTFTGTLSFADLEEVFIHQVALVVLDDTGGGGAGPGPAT